MTLCFFVFINEKVFFLRYQHLEAAARRCSVEKLSKNFRKFYGITRVVETYSVACTNCCLRVAKYTKVTQSPSTGVAFDLCKKDFLTIGSIQESKSSNVLLSTLTFLKKYSLSKSCRFSTSTVNKLFSSLFLSLSLGRFLLIHSLPLLTFIFNAVLSSPVN